MKNHFQLIFKLLYTIRFISFADLHINENDRVYTSDNEFELL